MSRGWICTIIIIPVVCISLTSPCDYLTTACSSSLIQELTRWKSGNRADFCPAIKPKLQNFESWSLSDSLLLSSGFPIDPVQSNYVRQVPDAVFSFVNPTPLKTKVRLVAISDDVLQNILDLNPEDCGNSTEFLGFISGNTIMKGSIPMAHRYGGHQFGSWASQLGDGRAHLLGEYVNKKHERWELQLKGSGKTPYSRRGDGRAVLRSSVREFLCSEAFHYLGIPTSRAAALIVSNDPVIRDQFYNGNITQERAAVVLRLAPSWFRIGSLEILEENSEIDLLRHLVDFIIINHFKTDIDPDSTERYVEFFKTVFDRTINTVVKWMSVGFAHGVCNTDNFSILGLTIDFGPFGFVENYDGDFVPNTSDDEGRYRLEQQASVAMYNLDKLRIAILPLLSKKQRAKVKEILNNFGGKYQELLNNEFRKKLGIFNKLEKDELLIGSLFYLMQETSPDFTMTFRKLSDLEIKNFDVKLIPKSMWALRDLAKHKHFPKWLESYRLRLLQNPSNITDKVRRNMMRSVNPRYVLRNWIAEQAIQKANNNDFSEVRKVLKILKNPFTKQKIAEESGFADRRPGWASDLKVSCSS